MCLCDQEHVKKHNIEKIIPPSVVIVDRLAVVLSKRADMPLSKKVPSKQNSLVLGLLVSLLTFAYGSAYAHVHGQADLTVAMEANLVHIQLTLPAGDAIGFEHNPTNQQEQ